MPASAKNWSQHLQQIFDDGKRAAEEMREENSQLRQRVAYLEHELEQAPRRILEDQQNLETRVSTVTAQRDTLAEELTSLKDRLDRVHADNDEIAEQFVEIERQNGNFISLYVASSQLHATLDHDTVLRNIAEIVINLIGAEKFGVYLYDESTQDFRRTIAEGMQDDELAVVPFGDNLLSQVARSGELYMEPGNAQHDGQVPIAVLPLVVAGELMGLLVIFELLVQKDGFEDLDLELFELLASHAATALMSSQLYTRTERKAATLEGLIQLFKDQG